jgi:rRNA small subunit pseudouridine methyltransferase Nep1
LITLILVESALEVIPPSLRSNPIIIRQSKRRETKLSNMLLDVSIHHNLMNGLPDHRRRGRPDIIHMTLLSVLGSPLCRENMMQVYVHTRDDYVIEVDPSTHLPRVYNRFTGLMSQLFEAGRVPPNSEKPFLSITKQTLASLLKRLEPTKTVLFTRLGKPTTVEATMRELSKQSRPIFMIGGFPHEHPSEPTQKLADEKISIDKSMLESWVVAARAVYEYERAINLPGKRIGERTQDSH